MYWDDSIKAGNKGINKCNIQRKSKSEMSVPNDFEICLLASLTGMKFEKNERLGGHQVRIII